jgi:hypothetical protein
MSVPLRRVANPIAVRRFSVVGEPSREVILTIGKPRPDRRTDGNWTCFVVIEGIPKERRHRVHGVDAIQSLQLAMDYARRELDASGVDLTWLDEHQPGDLGLPFSAPTGYGLYFQRRCEQWLERKTLEMANALTAVIQERARRRAARSGSSG